MSADDKAARSAFARRKSALRKAMAEDRLSRAALGLGTAILENVFGSGGYCGLSIAQLERKTGVRSPRTVHLALAALVGRGYVTVEKCEGGRQTNRIYLADEVPAPLQNCTPAIAPDCRGTPANQHTGPLQPAAPLPLQPAAPLLKKLLKGSKQQQQGDGAGAPAAAAADDHDGDGGSQMTLNALRRALLTGEVSLADVEDVVRDVELTQHGQQNAELERQPARLHLIRHPGERLPPPATNDMQPPPPSADDELELAFLYWSEKIRHISGRGVNYQRKLGSILREHGLDAWRRVVDRVPQWAAHDRRYWSFPFMMRAGNFEAVLYGEPASADAAVDGDPCTLH